MSQELLLQLNIFVSRTLKRNLTLRGKRFKKLTDKWRIFDLLDPNRDKRKKLKIRKKRLNLNDFDN